MLTFEVSSVKNAPRLPKKPIKLETWTVICGNSWKNTEKINRLISIRWVGYCCAWRTSTFVIKAPDRVATFAPKWIKLAPNMTNPGFFKIRFQYILAHRAKMYWNLILKSLIFVQFGAKLTYLGPKSGFPV